jgi:hypothetical protein
MTKRVACLLGVSLAVLSTGCERKRYKWVDVPYCKVDSGRPTGRVDGIFRILQKSSSGHGVAFLTGANPTFGEISEFDGEVLVAVVTCNKPDLLPIVNDAAEMKRRFNPKEIPPICAGQATVVPPTRVRAEPAIVSGYHGVLRFPRFTFTCVEGQPSAGEM